jgi:hypothetical protein
VFSCPLTLLIALTLLQSCLELLTSQDSTCFFITLLNFMHEEFVRASPSYPHDLEARVGLGRGSLKGWEEAGVVTCMAGYNLE